MTESATNVVVGFRTLRKFCENVGELLTKATELMDEGGWQRIWKWTPAIDICVSLEDARWWLPESFFCYYEHEESQHILPFIAILVDDLACNEDYDPNRVKEPLISAGLLEYRVGKNAKDEWNKNYAAHVSHLWMKDRRDDGTLFSGDLRDIWEDEDTEAGAIKITTLAYPLEMITDSDALNAKIVKPLIDLLSQKKMRTR